nr:MAG TPA: hypothetical protein [Caudoviricetes sp.]
MTAYTPRLFRGIARATPRPLRTPTAGACCSGSPTSTAPAGGGT